MRTIEGTTADEVWLQTAHVLLDVNLFEPQPSRAGDTREIGQAMLSISDPRQRWCLSRRPSINPAFAVAEIIWILRGREDSAFLNFWNTKLPDFAGNDAIYHGAYGKRLRSWGTLDQLQKAFHILKSNQASRQVVLQIWDPLRDLPSESGVPRSADVPCNVSSMLKVRKGRLYWTQVLRSNDVFLGLPYNLIQFTTLQEVLAGWLGLDLGSYTHFADSLHVYTESATFLQTSVVPDNVPHPNPLHNEDRLDLNKEDSDAAFSEMEKILEELMAPSLTKGKLLRLLTDSSLPQGHRNLLCLPSAEAARRHRWLEEASAIMDECSNPVLVAAWEQWVAGRRAPALK